MVGFGNAEKESFGVRNAKPGEWYSYGMYSQGHTYGKFAKLDDPFVYFSEGPVDLCDETGSFTAFRKGEIAVPLQSLTTFFPATEEAAKHYLNIRNWYRAYLGELIAITHANMEPAIGKARQVFGGSFHLLPYVSSFNGTKQIVESGKDKVVSFATPGTIEVISQKALDDYLKQH